MVDEFPGMEFSPMSLGGSSVTLHLYVEDVDALFDDLSPKQLQERAAAWSREHSV